MSTAAVRAPQKILDARQRAIRRGGERRGLAVPLDVTVLRSGVPDAVPGRSVDVCGGGVGAILAGELFPGEVVGVEFELPQAGRVLAKARVCYQERLRCGLQFLAIPTEQRAMIERWTSELKEGSETTSKRTADPNFSPSAAIEHRASPTARSERPPIPRFLTRSTTGPRPQERVKSQFRTYQRRKILMALIASVVVAVGMGWWRWEQGWHELESRLPGQASSDSRARVKVAPEVMEQRLVHQVDVVAPEGPRRSRVAGVAVLDAVVGVDGSVVSLRPLSGPDILTRAAMDAVQWWRFEPYRLNGQVTEAETTIAIQFR